MIYLGAHLSSAKGFYKMVQAALAMGACLLYTSPSPRDP